MINCFRDYPNDYKIVIVAIIGKSCFNSMGLKVKPIGRLFASTDRESPEDVSNFCNSCIAYILYRRITGKNRRVL